MRYEQITIIILIMKIFLLVYLNESIQGKIPNFNSGLKLNAFAC